MSTPSVGDPPLIQASLPKKSITPVSGLRPVEKPSANALSRKAHRNVQPIAMRRSPHTTPAVLPTWCLGAAAATPLVVISVTTLPSNVLVAMTPSFSQRGQDGVRPRTRQGPCGPFRSGLPGTLRDVLVALLQPCVPGVV